MRQAVVIILSRESIRESIYLVRRSPSLRFFGGYWALPGGTLDPTDHQVPVRRPPLDQTLSPARNLKPFVAAAARELFEETGVWMGRGRAPIPRDRLAIYRKQLLSNEIDLATILDKEGQDLCGDDFQPRVRFVTPEFSPLRYDTWYLECRIPRTVEAHVLPGELSEGRFMSPGQAWDEWLKGRMPIVPPLIDVLDHASHGVEDHWWDDLARRGHRYLSGHLPRMHFSPGVLTLPLRTQTRPPATHTNAYIVGDRQAYLIDPGCSDEEEQQRLWAYLDDIHSQGGRFRGILLTHSHSDHVGAVEECRRRYSLSLLAHPAVAMRNPALQPNVPLKGGESLELGTAPDGTEGWRLEVHHTPGHAPGHLIFRETRYGAVFAGDLVSPLSSILVDPSEGRLSEFRDSLEKLAALTDGFLYPGHGPPQLQGRTLVEKSIRHRQRRERQLLDALASEGNPEVLLSRIYDDVPPAAVPLARRSLLAGLIDLQERGLVIEREKRFELLQPQREQSA